MHDYTEGIAGAMAAAILAVVVINRPHKAIQPESAEPLPSTSMLMNAPSVAPTTAAAKVSPVSKPAPKEPEFFISPGEAAAIQRLLRGGAAPMVEISIVTIEPQPLPETKLTPISVIEPFPNEPSIPVVTPKGDLQ